MMVVAITGGMGSGKSRASNIFHELGGVTCIDTDEIARQLTAPTGQAYEAICQHFGPIILPSGLLIDRDQLRKIVFTQPKERVWLEQLLHPMITEQVKQEMKTLNTPYCVVQIPLLAEIGKQDWINRVLVIDASSKVRIERIQKRSDLTADEIKAIFATQATRNERLAVADDIIENNGSKEELLEKVRNMHEYYLHISKDY